MIRKATKNEKGEFTRVIRHCLPIKGLKANLSYALIGDSL
jgi:hypothetical protein